MRFPAPALLLIGLIPPASGVQRIEVKAGDNVTLAVEKSRELRRDHPGEPIEMIFYEGVHRLTSPLHFGPEDSGTAEAPLRLIAAPGTHPVLSGSREIRGFEAKDNGRWRTKVDGPPFEQLWIGERRAVRARAPDTGFFRARSVKEEVTDSLAKETVELDDAGARWLKDLPPAQLSGVQMLAYHKWDNTRRYLDGVSGSTFTITGHPMPAWNRWDQKTGFVFENLPSALDQPGEWYLSPEEALTYLPRPGEEPGQVKAEAPLLERLIILDGHPGAKVEHIEFRGLSFQKTGWVCPPKGFDPAQAAATVEAVIQADYAEAVSFQQCEIAHTGLYGLWFRKGCKNCEVKNTYLHDLGAGGVRIGTMEEASGTSGITVQDCIIHDAGRTFPCAAGVWIGFSGDNVVLHNEIAYMPYTGVSVGWRWGYAGSEAKRNRVDYNHIHHIGNGLLSDMGGVYTLGPSEGSSVSHNRVHDILSYDYGGWGLYNDEGSTGILLEDNLVYRTTSGGYHEHYGKENIVRNNIFAFARDQQLQFTRPEEHVSFHFTGNIVTWDRGPLWEAGSHGKGNYEVDRNILWPVNGAEISCYGKNFAEWQAQGKDAHSVIADPGFIDPANGDFHFKDPETVKKLGFTPFDYAAAGVEGDSAWRELARRAPEDWSSTQP